MDCNIQRLGIFWFVLGLINFRPSHPTQYFARPLELDFKTFWAGDPFSDEYIEQYKDMMLNQLIINNEWVIHEELLYYFFLLKI